MIYDDKQFRANLILTVLAFAVVALALLAPGLSDTVRGAVVAAAFAYVAGLWRRSGLRKRPPKPGPPGGGGAQSAEDDVEARLQKLKGTLEPGAPGSPPLSVQRAYVFPRRGLGVVQIRVRPSMLPVLWIWLALLTFSGCDGELRWSGGWRWPARGPAPSPQALLETDGIEMKPKASAPTCTSGRTCVYSLSADGLIYTIEGGTALKLHAARSVRTSADCAALSSPAAGDVCYDTSLGVFRFYAAGWTSVAVDDSLLLHKAGAENVTGTKTWNADQTTTDNSYDWGDATHRFQQLGVIQLLSGSSTGLLTAGVADGGSAVAWILNNTVALSTTAKLLSLQDASVEVFAVQQDGAVIAPSIGTAAGAQHALPAGTAAILTADSTATVTGKSIDAGQLTGNVVAARIATALTAPGPIGSVTPDTGSFSTLAVAGASTAASFFRTCTLTSAAAATPVPCLAAADVPAALSPKLAKWSIYVNGGTGWATTTVCTLEDTGGNDLVNVAVAALTADTFVTDHSANVTQEARYRLGTGGAADAGIQVVCDQNGTGSDLVVVVSGTIQ